MFAKISDVFAESVSFSLKSRERLRLAREQDRTTQIVVIPNEREGSHVGPLITLGTVGFQYFDCGIPRSARDDSVMFANRFHDR
jgi:hypothetical protein